MKSDINNNTQQFIGNDNVISSKGEGSWVIIIYNPTRETGSPITLGPIPGILRVSKQSYTVETKNSKGEIVIAADIPSPNVAGAYNKSVVDMEI